MFHPSKNWAKLAHSEGPEHAEYAMYIFYPQYSIRWIGEFEGVKPEPSPSVNRENSTWHISRREGPSMFYHMAYDYDFGNPNVVLLASYRGLTNSTSNQTGFSAPKPHQLVIQQDLYLQGLT